MNWDWYQATIPAPPDEVLGRFERAYGLWSVQPGRGLYSYDHGAEVRGERGSREVVARAFWGGVNGDRSVHVQSSGGCSGDVVRLLREHWPEHRVSRADSCKDWSHPKAWRRISKIAVGVAQLLNVRTSTVGDWIQAKAGRTLYLGGKTSRVQVRVYEKGKQLGADPDWVRLEVQVRPSGQGKSEVAKVEPAQLMQSSMWTAALAQRTGIEELERFVIRDPWRQTDDDRALWYCAKQYGGVFERKAAAAGGFEQLGLLLQSLIEQQRR